MPDHERILFRALRSLVDLIGDDDLPDNGELSGAAICDFARSVADAYETGNEHVLRIFEENEQPSA
jgi:hypothetical protein